jgi:hypothetical protein
MATISNPAILNAIEQLNYRVTIGDVSAHTGLRLSLAQQGLIELADRAGGHLQVTDTGEIIYIFSRNFRDILRNKFWRLRLKEWSSKVWRILFYLIRISFGIILILSIGLMLSAILVIIATLFKDADFSWGSGGGGSGNNKPHNSSSSGWFIFNIFDFVTDIFLLDREYRYNKPRSNDTKNTQEYRKLNFLESIFSFLFGDGNPNYDLEKRRWQSIATVIQNNRGAIIGEQIAPYCDDFTNENLEEEQYILPVLVRFNGYPEVSEIGEIIYYFPDLQITTKERKNRQVSAYLEEDIWQFSQATNEQKILTIGLGSFNILLATILGYLMKIGVAAKAGAFVGFVISIYWFLLIYSIAFFAIPSIRYFFLQWRNRKIERRNYKRKTQANFLQQNLEKLRSKLDFASQFARRKIIKKSDIIYSTETDAIDQDIQRRSMLDVEWEKRLGKHSEDNL